MRRITYFSFLTRYFSAFAVNLSFCSQFLSSLSFKVMTGSLPISLFLRHILLIPSQPFWLRSRLRINWLKLRRFLISQEVSRTNGVWYSEFSRVKINVLKSFFTILKFRLFITWISLFFFYFAEIIELQGYLYHKKPRNQRSSLSLFLFIEDRFAEKPAVWREYCVNF